MTSSSTARFSGYTWVSAVADSVVGTAAYIITCPQEGPARTPGEAVAVLEAGDHGTWGMISFATWGANAQRRPVLRGSRVWAGAAMLAACMFAKCSYCDAGLLPPASPPSSRRWKVCTVAPASPPLAAPRTYGRAPAQRPEGRRPIVAATCTLSRTNAEDQGRQGARPTPHRGLVLTGCLSAATFLPPSLPEALHIHQGIMTRADGVLVFWLDSPGGSPRASTSYLARGGRRSLSIPASPQTLGSWSSISAKGRRSQVGRLLLSCVLRRMTTPAKALQDREFQMEQVSWSSKRSCCKARPRRRRLRYGRKQQLQDGVNLTLP